MKKIPENVKERVGVEFEVNTDLVMLCHTTITSTSSTLKNLYIGKDYHSLYSTENYNDKRQWIDYSVHTLHQQLRKYTIQKLFKNGS